MTRNIEERILSAELDSELEDVQEHGLRPKCFDEFIGQKNILENIKMMMISAQKRKAAMDHVLLAGPPGLGKTSLAILMAKNMGTKLHLLSAPAIDRKGDLAAVLTNISFGDVVFIDEIHRLHISIEELLYSALEDFRFDIIIGQGPSARTVRLDLQPFTLIGATTKTGLLSAPLRDRFPAHFTFDFYDVEDLTKIVELNCQKLSLSMDKQAANLIASRSRGTPRVALRILRRVRDYAIVKELDTVADMDIKVALSMLEIDDFGLDVMDRKILNTILTVYNGGPVGIDALCATLGEDRGTIENVYEPFLLKAGLLMRTGRGRQLAAKGENLLKGQKSP